MKESEARQALEAAQRARLEAAKAMFFQFQAWLRRETGFDLQPYCTVRPQGYILDFELVPVQDWQPEEKE